MKILSEMDYINSDWLINGTGSMYRDGYVSESKIEQGLFAEDAVDADKGQEISEYPKEKHVQQSSLSTNTTGQQRVDMNINVNKKIKEIIIYYSDNTFETFTPH
jgi:hypothetical protein